LRVVDKHDKFERKITFNLKLVSFH